MEDEISNCQTLSRHRRHKTGVSLQNDFWKSLEEIADGRNLTLSRIAITRKAYGCCELMAGPLQVLRLLRDCTPLVA
jgi:hypothetical protein